MRRLAARRTGGAPDNKPGTGRHPVALLAGGLVAGLLLVAGTVVLWPRDRPATPPTSVSTPRASRAPTDPTALQKLLDGVVEAGAPGVVGPAGDHQVAFTYQDRALQLGLALSGLTLAGLGGIWWRRRLGSEPAGERWVNSRGRAADNGCAGKSGPAPF